MKYDKRLFILFSLLMIFVNSVQLYFEGSESLSSIFYTALGMSIISIPVWILFGGFILFNIIHALINLIKPDNELKFSRWDIANAGLIIGMLLKIFFNLQF